MKFLVVHCETAAPDQFGGGRVGTGMKPRPNPRAPRVGRRPFFVGVLWLVLCLLTATSGVAQNSFQLLDVVSGDYSGLPAQTAANGTEFGFSVAVSGEWMAVGAPGTIVDAGGARRGVVFMFRNQGDEWQLTQRIEPFSPAGQDPRCGHSVALSGSNMIIGCPGGSGQSLNLEGGYTKFYRREANQEWQFQNQYEGGIGDQCGTAVDIARNQFSLSNSLFAVTGCPQDESAQGRAIIYLFDGEQWHQGTSIFASDGASGDTFGAALAITVSCDFVPPVTFLCQPRLAVGAPTKQHGSAILGGAVYVYAGSNFNETDIFTHESPTTFGATLFGISVDINPSQLLVGSSQAFTSNCPNAPRCGRVFRWERDGSTWTSQIGGGAINAGGTPPGEQLGMRFSRAVALGFNNWIAIAAPLADGGEDSFDNTVEGLGLVELRRASNRDWGTNWNDTQDEFRPENLSLPLNYDDSQFGASIALGGQRWLAVGAPRWSSLPFPGAPRGAVWLYAERDQIFADRFQ